MNRPRNRQPRNNQRGSGPSSSRSSPATPQQASGSVPTTQQVVPGASVFIVLKEDQPTGKESPGVVGEILTRGNHPRGIKVRLRDGKVGRVQRMGGAEPAKPSSGFSMRYTDVRNEAEFADELPTRGLADFMPAFGMDVRPAPGEDTAPAQQTVARCPVCDVFEGDEAAVTHHIEREHFS